MMKRLFTAVFCLFLFLAAGRAMAQTPPQISNLDYDPLNSIFDPIVMTATISDAGGTVPFYTIHGTVDLPDLGFTGINLDAYASYFPPGMFPTFYDDGTHGDAVSGDGQYTLSLDIMQVAYALGEAELGLTPDQVDALVEQFLVGDISVSANLYVRDNNLPAGAASAPVNVTADVYNPKPNISELSYPQLVGLDDIVTISMRITDPDNTLPACIQVHGTAESPDFPELGVINLDDYSEYFEVWVCDNATNGDLIAGDGIYTVQADLGEAIASNLPPEFADYMTDCSLIVDFWVFDPDGNQSNTVTGSADLQQVNPMRPIITDISYPADVLTTDIVTVTMTLADPDGDIPAVIQLHGTVSSATFPNAGDINLDSVGVPIYLYDDGTNGDATAGDHVYTHQVDLAAAIAAHLPAQYQTFLTEGIVTGRIHVLDNAGHWSNTITASAHYDNPNAHRPVITEFTYPSFVLFSDTITVTARITDEDGDITHGCIQVHGRGSSPTFPNLGTLTTAMFPTIDVDMCDDGRQGDVTPGDGVYTITEKLSDHLGAVPPEYLPYLTDFLANGEWWVFDNAGHQSNVATGTVHFVNTDAARPVISSITFPASISTTDMVQITAAVSDANGDLPACLRVHGTISSPLLPGVEISYEDYETYMCDNGSAGYGDAIAGDGVYSYKEDMAVILSYVDPGLLGLIGDGAPLYGEMWVFDLAGHQSNVVTAFSEILNADPDAPVISAFVFPASAGPTDTVTVSAHIADANGDLPACVIAHGTASSPTYPNIGVIDIDDFASEFTIRLCDNGSMGDAVAGDGTYTHVVDMTDALAALPAVFQPLATDAFITANWYVFDLAGHQSNTVIGTAHYSDPAAHRPVLTEAVFPTFATTDDSVILSARITDAAGDIPTDSILVHTTATSSTFPNLGEIPFSFTLFDNGTNGDPVAHDGVYTQRIDIWRDVVPFIPAYLEPYATDIELTAIGWVFDNAGNQSNVVTGTCRIVDPDAHRPVISDFVFPANVESDDTFRITARITDPQHDLPACVLMHGNVTVPTFPALGALSLDALYPAVEIELCDDGLLGDNLAGDGIFTVQRTFSEVFPLVPSAYRQYLTEFNLGLQWWVFDNAGNQSNVASGSSHFYNQNPVLVSFSAPASVGPTDTIMVSAHLVDADGDLPPYVAILGNISSSTWPEVGTLDLETLGIPAYLYDNGTNGDDIAGDGIYHHQLSVTAALPWVPAMYQQYLSDGTIGNAAVFFEDTLGHPTNVWNASVTWIDPLNHAPVVSELTYPATADTNDTFLLGARVTDADGDITTNNIRVYAIATSVELPELGQFPVDFYLYDNGLHGDAVAHDGFYSRQVNVMTDILPLVPEAARTLISEGTLVIDAWVYDLAGHKSNTVTATTSFAYTCTDADGDFYGDGCFLGADCNDLDPLSYPGADEILGDGIDENCDGAEICYVNLDGDPYRTDATLPSVDSDCADAGEALAAMSSGDCDDATALRYPGLAETCDGIDNDCDLAVDNGVLLTFYQDFDLDGHGNTAVTTQACAAPGGYVTSSDDCDDLKITVFPGAPELCDGIDNQCNGDIGFGLIDEGCVMDSDNDGLPDNEEATLGTDPNNWDTDNDGLSDKFEADNMTGHADNLDPLNALDGLDDFDSDGIPNAHDYWNGTNLWAPNLTGYLECGYWAESDGEGFITGNDYDTQLSASIGNPVDYSGVYPNTGETQDLDADGFFTGNDTDLLISMMTGSATGGIPSRPQSIQQSVATTCGPTLSVGDTCSVSVIVINFSSYPEYSRQAGIPVVFTVDPSSTGAATIFGGEGAGDLGGRYDLSRTNLSEPAGQSRAMVRIDGPGTVNITARIPQCGTEVDTGRSYPEIVLPSFATILVP